MARRSPWLLRIAFGLALLVTLGFGVRLGASLIYWANPDNRDQPVEGWMPVGFVARSWQVPPEVLVQALGLTEGDRPRQTLEQIARDRGAPVADLVTTLEAAIDTWRAAQDE
jgi:hypothetical protein